jgi:hypothetical protein
MRILLINPPHPSIGSRIPLEHLPPLGLLSVGGPLIDAGNRVDLFDAEFGPMPLAEIVTRTVLHDPDAILLGHSGSASGHPIVVELTRALLHAKLMHGSFMVAFSRRIPGTRFLAKNRRSTSSCAEKVRRRRRV